MKIGIDISLSSTSIYIIDGDNEYVLCYMNNNKTSKWAKLLNNIDNINIIRFDSPKKSTEYSLNEINKLKHYDLISNLIINDLLKITKDNYCEITIEGYSYTKNTSSIVDIIGFSTLIRQKLLSNINCEINIIAPKTLKIETCKTCYGITEVEKYSKKSNKKLKSEFKILNNDGVSGGSFTKFEMLKSIIECNVYCIIYDFLIENKDILDMKKIPSPIDDIVDSIMLVKSYDN